MANKVSVLTIMQNKWSNENIIIPVMRFAEVVYVCVTWKPWSKCPIWRSPMYSVL